MPSTYAHRRFGADVLVQLPRELREKITPYRPLYDMGLHGPDLMFYYRALQSNPVNRLGNAMHEQPGRVFFTRARGVVNTARNKNAALAYALGFVCHFALDSTCHPYVERYTRESGVSHCEIETEFDNQLMREDGLDPMHFFTAGHIRPNREFAKIIAPFYENVTADETYGAMRGMVRVHHLLQATSPIPGARPATKSWKRCISRLSRWQCGSSRNMWKGSPTAHRWTRPMTTPSENFERNVNERSKAKILPDQPGTGVDLIRCGQLGVCAAGGNADPHLLQCTG